MTIDTGLIAVAAGIDKGAGAGLLGRATGFVDGSDAGFARGAAMFSADGLPGVAAELVIVGTFAVATMLTVGATLTGAELRATGAVDGTGLPFGTARAVEAGAVEGAFAAVRPRTFAGRAANFVVATPRLTGEGPRIALIAPVTNPDAAANPALTDTAIAAT
jgi:hypothetical protein